jgi:hypothetical protein
MTESYEREMGERYVAELDAAAELLQRVHYIGLVKAIGRLEVVKALEDIVAEVEKLRAHAEKDDGRGAPD